MDDIQLEWTVSFVMQPSFYTVKRNCFHEYYDGQNSISEQKTDFIKKKWKYILFIHWKAGSFNVIIFQFYSQSYFQHFLSTSEVTCYNNTLLESCQERPSLPTHFLITLTSYNTGSRTKNIDPNLNYWERISCSNYDKYGIVYISASIIKFYL